MDILGISFYFLKLGGAMNLGLKSSDGSNPSQSDIFPEKYTQCRQQFYLHSRPRKPWEKTLEVWPTLHLFFLPNHHKWTNATSLCKQDILSLNHSTNRGNQKWQINSEFRTFKWISEFAVAVSKKTTLWTLMYTRSQQLSINLIRMRAHL